MSIRNRTTKLVARRHDLNYFKHTSPLRLWQWYLALGAIGVAILWFAGSSLTRGNTAFSSGPISSSHAVFGQQCEVCHVPVVQATRFTPSFGRRNHVPDSACLSCHAGAITGHHAAQSVSTQTCSSCHTEHIGSTHLANTADKGCTSCHSSLKSQNGTLNIAANVGSFAHEHPDFRPLRTATASQRDAAFALRFTHAEHMQAGLSSPDGPTSLTCQHCHTNAVTPGGQAVAVPGKAGFGFAPVSFEKSCQSCHSLDFDTHLKAQAPHADPATVRAFVVKAINGFAQQHPQVVQAELQNWPAEALLPGQRPLPPPRSTAEWIDHRIAYAEIILYREKCELCHRDLNRPAAAAPNTLKAADRSGEASQATLRAPLLLHRQGRPGGEFALRPVLFTSLLPADTTHLTRVAQSQNPNGSSDAIPRRPDSTPASSLPAAVTASSIALPQIEPAHSPERWFGSAVFSHPAHNGVQCAECHAQALTSNSGKDVLLPGIATCRRCHDGQSSPQGPPVQAGHAESGCFLCHVYHGPATGQLSSTHSIAALSGR